MFSWVDGEGKVGVALDGTGPLAVKPDAQSGTAELIAWPVKNLNHVDQTLAGLGLSERLALGRMNVELDIRGAACGLGGGDEGFVLRERGGGEEKQECDESGFHGLPPLKARAEVSSGQIGAGAGSAEDSLFSECFGDVENCRVLEKVCQEKNTVY
jgi:hypothetical protein